MVSDNMILREDAELMFFFYEYEVHIVCFHLMNTWF